jgi:hypothetical protein
MPIPNFQNLLALFDWAMLKGDYELYLIIFAAITKFYSLEYQVLVAQRNSEYHVTYSDFIHHREMQRNFKKLEVLLDMSFRRGDIL